jgi:hypothetical protein
MATVTGRDRMISPGAPAGASPGSKKASPVYAAKGGAVTGGPAAAAGEDEGAAAPSALVVAPAALAAGPASSAAGALACAGGTRLADVLDAPCPPHAASSARVATSGPDPSQRAPR